MTRYNSQHKAKKLPSAIKDKRAYNHDYWLKVTKPRLKKKRRGNKR